MGGTSGPRVCASLSQAGAQTTLSQAKLDVQPAPLVYEMGQFGENICPPRLIHAVDPKYTQAAKKAKYSGVGLVSLIVDQQGRPRDVHARTLGMGVGAERGPGSSAIQIRTRDLPWEGG